MKTKNLLLTFMLIIHSLITANAQRVEVDGIYYTLNSQTYTATISAELNLRPSGWVVKQSNCVDGDFIIPSKIYYDGQEYSVVGIGALAFCGCIGMTSISIPSSIKRIDFAAFEYCTNLSSVHIPDLSSWCNIKFVTNQEDGHNIYSTNPLFYAKHLYVNDEEIDNDLIIPDDVTSISDLAFINCVGLTSVSIPQSVTSYGEDVFMGCSNLKSYKVRVTDNYTFCENNCVKLLGREASLVDNTGKEISDFIIPDGVTNINNETFKGCSGLTSITIPNSVTTIAESAFSGCSSLTSITIPNSVTTIAESAFSGCSSLTSITIPNSVTSIGYSAFSGCSGLTSITIPNSVTTIAESAFSGCSGLTSITIPNSVTTIAESAFSGCSGLTSITIPNSVTTIGSSAFSGCSGLTSITIPNSVTSIGYSAFSGCSNLRNLIIDSETISEMIINNFNNISITDLIIGNSTKTIDENALCGLSNTLKNITIGSSVEVIKTRAFSGFDNLETVRCNSFKVPDTHRTAFENSYVEYVSLYVPKESVEEYKTTMPWSGFKEVVPIEETDPISDNTCSTPTISFIEGRLVFDCETDGAICHYEINIEDAKEGVGAEVPLTAAYDIVVFASKEGYNNSPKNTATLYWVNEDPTPTGIIDNELSVVAKAVLVQNTGGQIVLSGVKIGTDIVLYDTSGRLIGQTKASNPRVKISTSLNSGDICIIKIGQKSVKYVM